MAANISKRETTRHYISPDGCTQYKIFLLKKSQSESDQASLQATMGKKGTRKHYK